VQVELVTGPRALLGSLEAYNAATGRNVTVLPPGQVFAYDWHKVQHPVGTCRKLVTLQAATAALESAQGRGSCPERGHPCGS